MWPAFSVLFQVLSHHLLEGFSRLIWVIVFCVSRFHFCTILRWRVETEQWRVWPFFGFIKKTEALGEVTFAASDISVSYPLLWREEGRKWRHVSQFLLYLRRNLYPICCWCQFLLEFINLQSPFNVSLTWFVCSLAFCHLNLFWFQKISHECV